MNRRMTFSEEFTEEEQQYLLKNVERGKILKEKENFYIEDVFLCETRKKKLYPYEKEIEYILTPTEGTAAYDLFVKNKQKKEELKNKIIKALDECDEFRFEGGGEYDPYEDVKLITYKIEDESDEIFNERLKTEGRSMIKSQKAKLAWKRKKETRTVLFEKIKKKKTRKSKGNVHYRPAMLPLNVITDAMWGYTY